jgi:hypothetical protein
MLSPLSHDCKLEAPERMIREAYPNLGDKTGKFVCVDISADKPLKTPVTMAAIKADMALAKYARLSVQPVTAGEWKIVCRWADDKCVIAGLDRTGFTSALPSS